MDARLSHDVRAEDAWLHGGVEGGAREIEGVERGARCAKRFDFRVRGGVEARARPFVALAYHAIGTHHERANRHVARVECELRELDAATHVMFVASWVARWSEGHCGRASALEGCDEDLRR